MPLRTVLQAIILATWRSMGLESEKDARNHEGRFEHPNTLATEA